MHHREYDKKPHHHMMPLAHREIASHQRDDPGKQVRQPGFAHGGVHAESRQTLKHKRQKSQKVGESCQRVVPDGVNGFGTGLEDVHFKDFHHFLPLAPFQGDEEMPTGKGVADKSPIDPEEKVKEKDERGHKMDKPDRPEPIAEGRFSADLEGQGTADDEAGRDQDAHAKGIDPVVEANGQFPNINSLHCRRSHKPLLKRVEVMHCAAFFVVQVHGTSQAGIE